MEIFDKLKSVATVLREADKIEQYQQILDALEKLLEMQNKIIELEGENRSLKDEIRIKKNLVHKAEVYFLVNGDKEDGPFCALCYDAEKLLIRMTHWNEERKKCPHCGKVYLIR